MKTKRFVACWTASVLLFLLAGSVFAHPLDQVRAKIESSEGGWRAQVWVEAWAAYPEGGEKAPQGEPGAPGTGGQAWMETLDAADFQIMEDLLEDFLRQCFVLTLNGQRLEFAMSVHGLDGGPQGYELTDEGNARIRADLTGALPVGVSGSLEVVWNDSEDEPLALEVVIPREGRKPMIRVLRIAPRDEPIELMQIDAVEGVAQGRTITLLGWIVAGFEHILPKGLDHILFILGLFFLQPKFKPLLAQSLAFTVAHSITLAMVVLGVFEIDPRFVESMIALSIAYVGVENLWVRELKPWRVAFVFGLGLLHGMGFASVMQDLDIPAGSVVEPLFGFNLGVEAGQVTVLALAFVVWFGLSAILRKIISGEGRDEAVGRLMRRFAMGSSAAIAVVGLYWTFERALG